jgi:hypothetical protein
MASELVKHITDATFEEDVLKSAQKWIDLSDSETIWRD